MLKILTNQPTQSVDYPSFSLLLDKLLQVGFVKKYKYSETNGSEKVKICLCFCALHSEDIKV